MVIYTLQNKRNNIKNSDVELKLYSKSRFMKYSINSEILNYILNKIFKKLRNNSK